MAEPDSDLSHVIPRTLDEPGKFLFWDLDVAGVAMMVTLLGLASGQAAIGLIAGIGAAAVYQHLKRHNHSGMASHALYWWTGLPRPSAMPPSHWREFNG